MIAESAMAVLVDTSGAFQRNRSVEHELMREKKAAGFQ